LGKQPEKGPMNHAAPHPVKCVRCGKPAAPIIYRTIYYQGYDYLRRKKVAMSDTLPFCSEEHASHEQMSREG
jgi:hypothetical protein